MFLVPLSSYSISVALYFLFISWIELFSFGCCIRFWLKVTFVWRKTNKKNSYSFMCVQRQTVQRSINQSIILLQYRMHIYVFFFLSLLVLLWIAFIDRIQSFVIWFRAKLNRLFSISILAINEWLVYSMEPKKKKINNEQAIQ